MKNKYIKEVLKNGYAGQLGGYRIHGKSYDVDGNQIEEVHEEDCFCCRKNLFKKNTPSEDSV